jgi:hypothetical protein
MSKSVQCHFRLEEDFLAKLDAYAKEMEAEQPGLKPTRSDALRVLVEKGLQTVKGTTRKFPGML